MCGLRAKRCWYPFTHAQLTQRTWGTTAELCKSIIGVDPKQCVLKAASLNENKAVGNFAHTLDPTD